MKILTKLNQRKTKGRTQESSRLFEKQFISTPYN